MNDGLILASRSPRRVELLRSAGVEVKVVVPEVKERPFRGEEPGEFALRVATMKTREVARTHPGSWILGADTVVVLGERILGKPEDEEEAKKMLRLLSGREHRVITAYALLKADEGKSILDRCETRVKFIPLTEEEIAWYVSTGEPMDKAGAYAIQGRGSFMVEWIEGSWTNVVGLPLAQVLRHLRELGIWRPRR
ncbi:MAG: septum formation protein Maf [Deltaproteobacteria bacterium]|nr:MAG: septum formation protein Maf [Deltaproteobacteria bacterium]